MTLGGVSEPSRRETAQIYRKPRLQLAALRVPRLRQHRAGPATLAHKTTKTKAKAKRPTTKSQ
jgi:hypothetical protein